MVINTIYFKGNDLELVYLLWACRNGKYLIYNKNIEQIEYFRPILKKFPSLQMDYLEKPIYVNYNFSNLNKEEPLYANKPILLTYRNRLEIPWDKNWNKPIFQTNNLEKTVISRSLLFYDSIDSWKEIIKGVKEEKIYFLGTLFEYEKFQIIAKDTERFIWIDSGSIEDVFSILENTKTFISNENHILGLAQMFDGIQIILELDLKRNTNFLLN